MKNLSKKQSKAKVWVWVIGIIIFFIIVVIISGIKQSNNSSSSKNLDSNVAEEKTKTQSGNSTDLSYKIFGTDDLSIKALGNKLLSQYSTSEIQDLPMDKRFSYNVLVAKNISEEDLRKTAEKVVGDTRKKDNDIDELTMLFYDNEKEITPSGKAIWAPNGSWGSVTPEIARSNNRAIYKIDLSYYEFSKSDSSNQMTDKEREIYDFYYDNLSRFSKEKGPDADTAKGGEIDSWIVNEIKKKFSISEDELDKILMKDR